MVRRLPRRALPGAGARRHARPRVADRLCRVGKDVRCPADRADAAGWAGAAACPRGGAGCVRRSRHEAHPGGERGRHLLRPRRAAARAAGLPEAAADGLRRDVPPRGRGLRRAAARHVAIPPQGRLCHRRAGELAHARAGPALRLPRAAPPRGGPAAAAAGARHGGASHLSDGAAARDAQGRLAARGPLARGAHAAQARGRARQPQRAPRQGHDPLSVRVRRRAHHALRGERRPAPLPVLPLGGARDAAVLAPSGRDRHRVP
mmetsp:Transcript_27749/g.82944  ORF Transcript_27749/g.82944 Transcript_27749/m.82944 type:complete len:262 (+) Transcript_27749:642-1427(+)